MMPNATQKKDPKDKKAKDPNAGCAGKSMLYISPIMTLWIGTIAPSGLAFYWIINSVLSYLQHLLLNIKFKKEKEGIEVAKVSNKGSKNS